MDHDHLQPWHIRGATKAIAERAGITESAVSQWRHGGVPAKHQALVREVIAELLGPRMPPADAA